MKVEYISSLKLQIEMCNGSKSVEQPRDGPDFPKLETFSSLYIQFGNFQSEQIGECYVK
jgi:hypothetical protein